MRRDDPERTRRYIERLIKFLLWHKGGWRVLVGQTSRSAAHVHVGQDIRPTDFDRHFMGEQVYGHPFEITSCAYDDVPAERESAAPLGRHLDGCRMGFDLGASDRKSAAVIDGKVVFSTEVPWAPAVQSDPQYHFDGIHDSLWRAAEHLPRVDAIGGSAAGVYVANEVRVGSLYRGV